MTQMGFQLRAHNPDVLTCIANLSNDEVFTPPETANHVLTLIEEAWAKGNDGSSIWSNPEVRFLDPFTKSGVFLREVTRRLTEGLVDVIPSLDERVNHILTQQVFGIALTQLTSYMSRRSVYCSKQANGPHSIAHSLDTPEGNIWFERTEHSWAGQNHRCLYCGASREEYARGIDLESHAYAFIHTDDIHSLVTDLFGENMQFDVIIGNPPYQLSDGGQGASSVPIYDKFVEQAKKLEPRYLSMIIPARWYFGGRGLESFRRSMLSDRRIRSLVDFIDSRQAFNGVDVAGGICYFLWDRDHEGDCTVESHDFHENVTISTRPLLEPGADIFIRNNSVLEMLRKIVRIETGEPSLFLPPEKRFELQVSGQKPFGLRTFYRGASSRSRASDVMVLQSGGRAWASRKEIKESVQWIDKWKVFTSKSSSEHAGQADKNGMRRVLSLSGILPPGSVVTETYVILGVFDTEDEARNCLSYVTSRFFRFLVATRTSAQDLPRSAYSLVPALTYAEPWSDGMLYERYDLTAEEIELIESTIKVMAVDS